LPLASLPAKRRVVYVFLSGSLLSTSGIAGMAVVPDWAVIPLSSETTSILGRGSKNTIDFTIYPNPSSGNSLQLNLNHALPKATIEVMDLQGRVLESFYKETTEQILNLPLSHTLQTGIYFIRISGSNGWQGTKTWVVR
jgi:hypothetical protein